MLFLLISSVIFLFLFHELYWKRRNLPPGPIPLPLIGNFLSLTKPKPGYECFRRWTKKYGDVYTFWLGTEPFVIIGSLEKIKETFVRDADTYVDKKPQNFQEQFRGGSYGVIETNGEFWKDHRRFALHQLRDLGLGRDLMQQKILIEVDEMFKRYDAKLNAEQNVPAVLNEAVANVVNQMVFGYRFDESKNEEFKKLRSLIDFQEKAFSSFKTIVQVMVPSVGKYLPGPSIETILANFREEFYTFFNSQIETHRAKINFDSEESEDFAEAYLKEQKRRELDGDFVTYNNNQLSNMCLDIWFAGLTSTTSCMSWGLSYMLNTPGVQENLHAELDRVIGSDRLVTTADKNDLPYMNAFIQETLRCFNVVPLNVHHMITRDTVINGYSIPKGTGVIAQLSTVMLDERVFPDPYRFDPGRFIENGKLKKIEEMVAFSIGKRQCLGEGLARMELFLFLANFFNRYQLKPSSKGVPSIDKSDAAKVTPRIFDGILTKRH